MIKQAKTEYPIVVAGKLYPAGTVVEVLSKNDKLVLDKFPSMQDNKHSNLIAVKFADRDTCSIGLKKFFTLL